MQQQATSALKYTLAAGAVLLLMALPWLLRGITDSGLPEGLRGFAVTPRAIGDVTLQGSNGTVIGQADFRGKWTLVFFGFTNCPDVCPATLMQMAQLKKVLQEAGADQDYRFLFVSVDPQRDTPARLRDYVGYFHPEFLAASGAPAQIKNFEIVFDAWHRLEQRSEQDMHYNVAHSASIFIVDRDARFVGKFQPPFDIRAVREGLAALNAYHSRGEGRA